MSEIFINDSAFRTLTHHDIFLYYLKFLKHRQNINPDYPLYFHVNPDSKEFKDLNRVFKFKLKINVYYTELLRLLEPFLPRIQEIINIRFARRQKLRQKINTI